MDQWNDKGTWRCGARGIGSEHSFHRCVSTLDHPGRHRCYCGHEWPEPTSETITQEVSA